MHLFLSPHLDDAVLSCGGTISHLTQRGEAVLILTVMAGDPPLPLPDTPIVQDLHRRWAIGESPVAARRAEDVESARVVGAQVEHRRYPDSVYRTAQGQALYPTEESIFGAIHAEDTASKYLAIESALFRFVYMNTRVIYAPLGVGHHVDHQIVRDWALDIRRLNPGLTYKFYEEYPYTRDSQAIERARVLFPDSIRMKREQQVLDAAMMRAKMDAIACYKSQISTFWKSVEAMQRDVEMMFCVGEGVYAERYWRVADQ